MDEDNITGTPRVTRARTRRLSMLDTETRPLTPLVDMAADRGIGSPRPIRRTRLNSATADLRTPTRSTRLSVARGETPEPITPNPTLSAVKRGTRTPAKSARKQLTLKDLNEQVDEEIDIGKMEVVPEVNEVAVVKLDSLSPPSQNVTPREERRVTRSMSKTPPIPGRTVTNIPQPQFDTNNSVEEKHKQTAIVTEIVATPVDKQKSLESDVCFPDNSASSTDLVDTPTPAEYPIPLSEAKSPLAFKKKLTNKLSISKDEQLNYKDVIVQSNDTNDTHLVTTNQHDAGQLSNQSCDDLVTAVMHLPALSPKTISRMLDEKNEIDSKKLVMFNNKPEINDILKQKYPKTPARLNTLNIVSYELGVETTEESNSETPLKPIIIKGRNSSTPLTKAESLLSRADTSSEEHLPPPPPLQIDAIKSYSELEKVSNIKINKETLTCRLPSEGDQEEMEENDEEKDGEDEDDEGEDDEEGRAAVEFFDNEVEVAHNYQSGDSMDSSERLELKQNEIPHDGESVGSQDTVNDCSEDENDDEQLSFIVSDNDDDGGDEPLCFSPASSDKDSVASDSKTNNKRRRIIVHSSSDDAQEDEFIDKGKEIKDQQADKSLKESKDVNNINAGAIEDLQCTTDKSQHLNTSVENVDDVVSCKDASSSDESEEQNKKSNGNKSVYEVLDSGEEMNESDEENDIDNPTAVDNESSSEDEKLAIESENPISNDSPNQKNEDSTSKESSPERVVCNLVESISKSKVLHNKEKREHESELLAELYSCDLSHLRQMFNPLQKSRRQTLYVKGPEMPEMEPKPKLKRRSEQLSSDVKPSQSFIETLAEKKRQLSKRKRMSKSFCGAADDSDVSLVDEVTSKKAKNTSEPTASVNTVIEPVGSAMVESPSISLKFETEEQLNKNAEQPKSRSYYLEYCDGILQAANEAKLEQKKQRNATGNKPINRLRSASVSSSATDAVGTDTINQESEKPATLKKNVKRLQATKQAVKHAIQLLVPKPGNKVPQSLSRKLSPQPEIKAKPTKAKRQLNKSKPQVSSVKSSDEENHHALKRIKTSAGYVVMSKVDKERIQTFKTASGIVRVEPCTPNQKYFKVIAPTPKNRFGFKEQPGTPEVNKKKAITGDQSSVNRNPATESALRFKREMFGRASK